MPRHYELNVWKDAMRLVGEVYRITCVFPGEEKFGPTAQMRRAAVSIPSNITEGAARVGRIELIRFPAIARGSLAEPDARVWIARDLGFTGDVQEMQDDIQLLLARPNASISSNRKVEELR